MFGCSLVAFADYKYIDDLGHFQNQQVLCSYLGEAILPWLTVHLKNRTSYETHKKPIRESASQKRVRQDLMDLFVIFKSSWRRVLQPPADHLVRLKNLHTNRVCNRCDDVTLSFLVGLSQTRKKEHDYISRLAFKN